MIRETIKLSPDVKNDFEVLVKSLNIDKTTKLRSIYLFEELIKNSSLRSYQIDKR